MISGGCDMVPLGLAPPVLDGCNSMTGLGLDARAKPSGWKHAGRRVFHQPRTRHVQHRLDQRATRNK